MSDFAVEFRELLEYEKLQIRERPAEWLSSAKLLYFWQYKSWFLELLNYLGEFHMSRGTGKPAKKAKTNYGGNVWFVNVAIAVDQADDIRAVFKTPEDVYAKWELAMRNAYRVSFNYDAQRDSIIASLSCRDEDSPNHNGVLNAFAGDWYTALMVVLYKHFVLLEEVWTREDGQVSRPAFG